MMKKILIIGTIASSMAFAKGFNNNNNMTTGQGMGGTQGKNYSQVANLTEAQQGVASGKCVFTTLSIFQSFFI